MKPTTSPSTSAASPHCSRSARSSMSTTHPQRAWKTPGDVRFRVIDATPRVVPGGAQEANATLISADYIREVCSDRVGRGRPELASESLGSARSPNLDPLPVLVLFRSECHGTGDGGSGQVIPPQPLQQARA